jgi:hypothetical protein
MPAASVIAYDRYKLQGHELTFGGFPRRNDFSTPTDRPQTTSGEWIYRKSLGTQ